MKLADQKPKQSETHSSTFPQDSDSDSESEIELRSTHSSPEITTSDESDGTLVDTSTSSTPTQSLSGGGGDLDSTEGHSQLLVGTLPLTDKDPPESREDKGPQPNSPVEGPASGSSEDNASDLSRDKQLATTPPSEKLKQVVDSPSEYPPQGQPEIPFDSEEGLEIPSSKESQKVPIDDPFSRLWSGGTADTSDKDKRRYGWLSRKPERRHSVELEALDEQDQRPYKYVLKRERDLFPRPRFYSKCPDASSISPRYAEFILRHIVQQRHQELEQEKVERERRGKVKVKEEDSQNYQQTLQAKQKGLFQ